MNYIYGPLHSRRLGLSLGLSIVPYKFCTFNCVYCQLKDTTRLTLSRKEYIKSQSILAELKQFLEKYNPPQSIAGSAGKLGNQFPLEKINYITIAGSGEPLLNSKIKNIIGGIQELCGIPVALITNSAMLVKPAVRRDILAADLIVPSLDAVTQDVFINIDRYLPLKIDVEKIIQGLIALRREFKGKIWLEIMLIRGLNDDLQYAQLFKEAVLKIKPDKIQLNTPTRPPSESWVQAPSQARLKQIQVVLGDKCEII